MPRSKTGLKRKPPSAHSLEEAVKEVLENKLSIRKAATKHNVSKSALARRVNAFKKSPDTEVNIKYNYDHNKVFTAEEENSLQDYILKAGRLNYGLTKKETKRLAFQFAMALGKEVPSTWRENEEAGEFWLRCFRTRHPTLALRKPEATSMARAMGFNKEAINTFFNNYEEILKRQSFSPSQIWNCDETGLSTVQRPPKVLAERGAKQVGQMTSAERGSNTTMIACVNAAGNSIPPLFIFPRVHFKPRMLKGAPPGSIGRATISGWSNENMFLHFIEHFIEHARPTLEQPQLIIMDNHQSHINIPVINKAKSAGVIMLTIPPHTSHRIQPLDKSVFGPFKHFYSRAMTDWLNNPGNNGRAVSIYDVAEIAGRAYEEAFNLKNIVSGFKCCGIFPLNRDIFSDNDFLPSNLSETPSEIQVINPSPLASLSSAASNMLATSPEALRPFPKKQFTEKQRQVKQKSTITTDTPEKIKIEERKAKKNKKNTCDSNKAPKEKKLIIKKKLQIYSSSEDEETVVLQDSDSEYDVEEDILALDIKKPESGDIKEGNFILVRCEGNKGLIRHYVALVLKYHKKGTEVKYLKKMQKTDTFVLNEEDDKYLVDQEDIILKLPDPEHLSGTSKRRSSQLKFPVNFDGFFMG